MIEYKDDWTVFEAPTQTIVNTVNCVGVMGKGLALEIRRRFPTVYRKYRRAFVRGELAIGKLQLVKSKSDRWVLNFPTKEHWRGRSRLSFIEKGLKKFASTYKRKGITSIAFPPLECGSGGLRWEELRRVMEKYLGPLSDLKVYVCLSGLGKDGEKPSASRRRGRRGGKKGAYQRELPF